MPQSAFVPAFASLSGAVAVGAVFRPHVQGRNQHFPTVFLNPANLIVGQAQHDLVVGQSMSPKIVLPIWDQGLPPLLIKSHKFTAAEFQQLTTPGPSRVSQKRKVQTRLPAVGSSELVRVRTGSANSISPLDSRNSRPYSWLKCSAFCIFTCIRPKHVATLNFMLILRWTMLAS